MARRKKRNSPFICMKRLVKNRIILGLFFYECVKGICADLLEGCDYTTNFFQIYLRVMQLQKERTPRRMNSQTETRDPSVIPKRIRFGHGRREKTKQNVAFQLKALQISLQKRCFAGIWPVFDVLPHTKKGCQEQPFIKDIKQLSIRILLGNLQESFT